MGRVKEALNVLWKAKYCGAPVFAFITANAFEDSQSIVQGVSEDVNVSIVPVNKLTINPDLLSLLHHGFRSLLIVEWRKAQSPLLSLGHLGLQPVIFGHLLLFVVALIKGCSF